MSTSEEFVQENLLQEDLLQEESNTASIEYTSETNQDTSIASTPETKSFLARNSAIMLNILGGVALAGAAVAAIYFTAGTILPWIVSAATTIGLNLSFLTTMSTIAASVTVAAVGTAALTSLGVAANAAISGLTSAWNWAFSGSPEESATPEESSIYDGSTANAVNKLGGANNAPEDTLVEAPEDTLVEAPEDTLVEAPEDTLVKDQKNNSTNNFQMS